MLAAGSEVHKKIKWDESNLSDPASVNFSWLDPPQIGPSAHLVPALGSDH